MLTGESAPVGKAAGDQVIGATINGTGAFLFRATAVGQDTALAQIVRLVEDAQGAKPPMQRLADTVSAWFVPGVLIAAAVTFTVWALAGSAGQPLDHGDRHRHRGAHHRLPLRARPGHPDRGHGGHRQGRRARRPDRQR